MWPLSRTSVLVSHLSIPFSEVPQWPPSPKMAPHVCPSSQSCLSLWVQRQAFSRAMGAEGFKVWAASPKTR